jgi:hypothetical protein
MPPRFTGTAKVIQNGYAFKAGQAMNQFIGVIFKIGQNMCFFCHFFQQGLISLY